MFIILHVVMNFVLFIRTNDEGPTNLRPYPIELYVYLYQTP